MENKRVNAEELKRILVADMDRLAAEITDAMNSAQPGRIIADSEEPVRDACAVVREQAYEKAIGLLQEKQEAFFPSASRVAEQGKADDNASDDQRAYQT